MPDQASALNAVRMFDLLLEFFDGGRRWTQMRFHDGNGNRCLVGAIDEFCRADSDLNRDAATPYMIAAMKPSQRSPVWSRTPLINFNDHHCKTFDHLRAVLVKARTLAQRDADSFPRSMSRFSNVRPRQGGSTYRASATR